MKLASVLVLFVALGLFGCGGGKCAGDYAGVWTGISATDELTLSSDCDYKYTGVGGCKSTGTYAAPISSTGSVAVTVTANTGGLCLPVGSYTCAYSTSTSTRTLTFDCGFGPSSYSR